MLDTLFLAIIFIISISLHEYAHAWASTKLGDPTPKIQGRLTPNPLSHIDPIGFILIFLIHFGRWKPVQINPAYYKHPLKDELLVALAWPAMNIALSIAWTLIMLIYTKIVGVGALVGGADPIIAFRYMFGRSNVALAVFNMIPIYPLDWYRIVKYLFPKIGYAMEFYRQYVLIALLILILFPNRLGLRFDPIGHVILTVGQAVYGIIQTGISFILF